MWRVAAPITVWNLVSRVTGLGRVLVVGAVLGASHLGNVYQSANLVPNLLFELLAAGVLSAVLVPELVARPGRTAAEAEALARTLLGAVCLALVPVVLGVVALAPAIVAGLTSLVPDERVRATQLATGTLLLRVFAVQLLCYGAGSVATGLLHARERFVATSAAPVANNALVIATMALVGTVGGARVGLPLDPGLAWLLALGTTAGVVAMSAVPFVALTRAGVRLRPSWPRRDAGLRAIAGRGAAAAGQLAVVQLLLALTVVLANRSKGVVVAYQFGYTCFLLPFALLAHPVVTALYPRLSAMGHGDDREGFAETLAGGVRALALLLVPASAVLAAAAPAVVSVLAQGALRDDLPLVAAAVTGYAGSAAAYALMVLLTRASYAAGDTRRPTVAMAVGAAVGAAGLWATAPGRTGASLALALGLGHTVAMAVAALVLGVGLRAGGWLRPVGPALVRRVVAGAMAGGAVWWVDGLGVPAVVVLAAAGVAVAGAVALGGGRTGLRDLGAGRGASALR